MKAVTPPPRVRLSAEAERVRAGRRESFPRLSKFVELTSFEDGAHTFDNQQSAVDFVARELGLTEDELVQELEPEMEEFKRAYPDLEARRSAFLSFGSVIDHPNYIELRLSSLR